MEPVARYLARHAEPAAVEVGGGPYRRVLVVPALAESPGFWAELAAAIDDPTVLTIVVVNETVDASADVRAANARLLAALADDAGTQPRVVIDATASGTPLPAGQGVGLARKIGFDLALRLWRAGRLTEPWIHSCDADARPSAASLRVDDPDATAWSLPFVHEPGGDPVVDEATAIYDRSLRYWVAGLSYAGSPWAHHTLGSALAVRADAYAAVGGMPRRLAGEDFHLLAKLAKLGPIGQPAIDPIRIRARRSSRVPFGTGPAVGRIEAALSEGRQPTFYDPAIFERLREILTAVDAGRAPDDPAWTAIDGDAGVAAAIRSARDDTQRRRRIREWLDALRTLKLVHALQADGRPQRPWRQALAAARFDVP